MAQLEEVTKNDWVTEPSKDISHLEFNINQDLSYGEIMAGRPGAWLVKKKYFTRKFSPPTGGFFLAPAEG